MIFCSYFSSRGASPLFDQH